MMRNIQTAAGHGLGTASVSMQMTTISLSGMHQTIRQYTELSVPNPLLAITANVQFMSVSLPACATVPNTRVAVTSKYCLLITRRIYCVAVIGRCLEETKYVITFR